MLLLLLRFFVVLALFVSVAVAVVIFLFGKTCLAEGKPLALALAVWHRLRLCYLLPVPGT